MAQWNPSTGTFTGGPVGSEFRSDEWYRQNGLTPPVRTNPADPYLKPPEVAPAATTVQESLSVEETVSATQPATSPVQSIDTTDTTFDAVTAMLTEAGLADLIPWYRQKLTEGASAAEIAILIQEQPAFKNRFKSIEARKNLGLPALSPQEVLAYEQQARGLMRASGLPTGFWDHYDDYSELLIQDVSLSELGERIEAGYARVMNSAPELRNAFFGFYGVRGPDMLAAYFLDPDKAVPLLQQQVEAAGIGGVGSNFGFDLSRSRSEYLVQNQVNQGMARQAFMNLTEISGLFNETFSEGASGAPDLQLENQGLDAALGLSGEAMTMLERRRQQRVAQFSGSMGGALGGQAGFAFGSASG